MERSGDLRPLTYYHLQPFWTGEQHKKEMLVDGQTHLVLIREEAGAPDAKVRTEEEGRQAGWGQHWLKERVLLPQVSLGIAFREVDLFDPPFAPSSPASSQAGQML